MSWISDLADSVGIQDAFKVWTQIETQKQTQTQNRLDAQLKQLQASAPIMQQQMEAMIRANNAQTANNIANAQAGAMINFERMKPWLVMAAIAGIAYVVVKG